MPSLFCDIELAARIERAEAGLIVAVGAATRRRTGSTDAFAIPIAGGLASFAEHGSPYNKVVGLGFGGVPSTTAIEEIESAFAARGAPTQIELAHLAASELGELLTRRGYRLEAFENVLGCAIAPGLERTMPAGIEVRRSVDEELDAWIDVVVDAVAHPDTQGLPWHEKFPREVVENAERDSAAAGLARYSALHDGVLAGGASLRVDGGVAQLAGAGTAPAHRRRGIQSALLSYRLADAVAAGCDVAVMTAQPGSRSHQNAQRQGFDLLYTRAVLVKHT
jgi:GNAT superfamily N-acetyltransferase